MYMCVLRKCVYIQHVLTKQQKGKGILATLTIPTDLLRFNKNGYFEHKAYCTFD